MAEYQQYEQAGADDEFIEDYDNFEEEAQPEQFDGENELDDSALVEM